MQPAQQEGTHSHLFACPAENAAWNTGSDATMMDFELFVGELEVDLLDGKASYSKMEVAGKIINFKLDTEVEANIIPLHIL